MAYYYPEGSKIYYSSTFAGAKTVSAVTNASPAVATSTSHGYTDLDPVLFNSGWEDAADTIWEIDQQSADTFQLVGLDSTSTTYYPAGNGTGTTQKVSSWVEVPQILDISSTGGGPKYATVSPLSRRNDIKTPIGFEAMSIDIGLGYDATNATWQAMLALTRTFTKVAIKIVVPGGGRLYGYGNLIASEMVEITKGNALKVKAAISLDGRMVGYGA